VRTASLPVETARSAQRASSPAWSGPFPPAWALVGAALVIHLTLCWVLRGFVTDDAWISVRYAENLADGEGFVWNPGGPRAEGFSNPLLVGIEALAHSLGWSASAAARGIGVLSGAACVVLAFVLGRHVVGRTAAAAGALITACSAPFAAWAVGGLETLLVALVLTAGTLEVARRDGGRAGRAAALFALLPWLRPEGLVVVAAVVAVGELPGLLRIATRQRAVVRILLLGGVPAFSQAVLEALRLGVYGHLLPNSVLYKSGAGDGLAVLARFLDQAWLPVLGAGAGLLLVRGRVRLLAVPPLVYAIGSIGTLDSANGYSRFFMPVWPLLALLVAVAVVRAGRAVLRRAGGAGVVAGVVLAGGVVLLHGPSDVRGVHGSAERYMACSVGAREAAADWLRRTPAGTTFAISDAGLVPARAGRTAVDAFFLNEPLIQETGRLSPAQRADLVHERDPDVIVLSSREAPRFVPMYPTEQAIHEHPDMAGYRLVHVAEGRGASCGYSLALFRR
jgi:arabinofuranosyltransferase